jgi:hypothetical protein
MDTLWNTILQWFITHKPPPSKDDIMDKMEAGLLPTTTNVNVN